ncbi:alpha/beta-hydrolase [Dacryopinax primogenitus]|uniref:Dipeptidyl-peptidase V n=1 Tax=Dacryopinax primogenitus (strain DJM 731) TaxID=1858805 RepID=M5FRZ0_DACPD|nr:alpha/beta-hydrolase [Dacryopinax primogenitus]EJU00036.1 alpha/beta-hydrolase [Dacryopinax primogenitus]
MSLEQVITGITSTSTIRRVVLSPSATQVIYEISPIYTPASRSNDICTLWISDVAPRSRARQLTSGEHNDFRPVWSTDESEVYFLSNRHKQYGYPGPAAIYVLPLKAGGEAYALTSTESKSGIWWFWLSPDGRYIAYKASRETTAEEQRKDENKDDAIVWGETKENAQLFLLNVATRQVRRLPLGAKDDRHVVGVAWSPDSKELVVLMKVNVDREFNESPLAVLRLSILQSAKGKVHDVCTLPRLQSSDVRWLAGDRLALLQSYVPEHRTSASTLFFRPASAQKNEKDAWQKHYGEVEDVMGLTDIGDGSTLALTIAYGVHTRVDLISTSGQKQILWQPEELMSGASFDVKQTKNGDYVLAIVASCGSRGEPNELWTGTISASALEKGETLKLTEKLSSHNIWTEEVSKLTTEVVNYKGEDGTPLEGVVTWLKGKERKMMPTIILPHGGPYYRDTPGFSVEWYWSREILAFAGYLVLCPQYRGSMGRGHDFARASHSGMGTADWTDSLSLLTYALGQGWADKDRLGLAGWSQGGFLAAWGVAQTKDMFKAAVVGSGICDWGGMAAEAEEPDFQSDLSGSAPWSPHRPDLACSPISHVQGVQTPVLILHGQQDTTVPSSQGVEFFRGLRRMSACREKHALVIYPREGHMIGEKTHAEDVMRRIVAHLDEYLK